MVDRVSERKMERNNLHPTLHSVLNGVPSAMLLPTIRLPHKGRTCAVTQQHLLAKQHQHCSIHIKHRRVHLGLAVPQGFL